jgi:hypothetical protein
VISAYVGKPDIVMLVGDCDRRVPSWVAWLWVFVLRERRIWLGRGKVRLGSTDMLMLLRSAVSGLVLLDGVVLTADNVDQIFLSDL